MIKIVVEFSEDYVHERTDVNNLTSNAPERIYVCDNVFPTHVDWDGSPINTKRIDDHDIEYIRKDAFIEKAIEYIITHVPDMHTLGVSAKMDECIIKDYRKYMEEK